MLAFRKWDLYQVDLLLGEGRGDLSRAVQVYRAINLKTDQLVAIKAEQHAHKYDGDPQLPFEAAIYTLLRGIPGVPIMHWYGAANEYVNVMTMDMLGPTLEQLRLFCRGRLSPKTVCMVAEQLITHLECIHERGVIVRDITPTNMAIGNGSAGDKVYLFDFGLARNFIDPDTGAHIPYNDDREHWVGHPLYCSTNTLLFKEVSRRDDMENLGYVLLFLLTGTLPWLNLYAPNVHTEWRYISVLKSGATFDAFATRAGPEFPQYFAHVRGLAFEQRPDYAALRALFRDRGWACDWAYDWKNAEAAPHGTLTPGEYVFDQALVQVPYVETF